MYPEFERIAVEEGVQSAVSEFQEQAKESQEHADIFIKAAKRFKALGMVERFHANRYIKALGAVQNKTADLEPKLQSKESKPSGSETAA